MRIGIVAGEASGDLLGAGLIGAVRARVPDAQFEGIAGPQMQAQGCRSLFPMEKLAVMGLFEVLAHYRELAAMRRQLIAHFRRHPPDIFIGIDAPDFNLGLEYALKSSGIPTVHYVSPSVWAWRQYRVRKIARSTDLMLTLFPFEAPFYEAHHVPVRFVGHPLADMIPLEVDQVAARNALGLPGDKKIVALLPGSRVGEVKSLGEIFLRTAVLCAKRHPELHFVTPLATPLIRGMYTEMRERAARGLSITLIDGRSREVMAAADVVLAASGTVTLEAALLCKPMVVAYRFTPLTYWLVKRMIKVPYCSLPNLIAGEALVPELIQEAATPEALSAQIMAYLEHPERATRLTERFKAMHLQLRQGANAQAAEAVLQFKGWK